MSDRHDAKRRSDQMPTASRREVLPHDDSLSTSTPRESMTAPTQAQIEAAAEKICRGCYSGVDYRTLDTKTKASWNEIAEAALTAAAQVEPTEYTQGYRHGFAGIQDEVRATVERCAQVAETLVFNEYGKNRQEIAAAIRKLRDEP